MSLQPSAERPGEPFVFPAKAVTCMKANIKKNSKDLRQRSLRVVQHRNKGCAKNGWRLWICLPSPLTRSLTQKRLNGPNLPMPPWHLPRRVSSVVRWRWQPRWWREKMEGACASLVHSYSACTSPAGHILPQRVNNLTHDQTVKHNILSFQNPSFHSSNIPCEWPKLTATKRCLLSIGCRIFETLLVV